MGILVKEKKGKLVFVEFDTADGILQGLGKFLTKLGGPRHDGKISQLKYLVDKLRIAMECIEQPDEMDSVRGEIGKARDILKDIERDVNYASRLVSALDGKCEKRDHIQP